MRKTALTVVYGRQVDALPAWELRLRSDIGLLFIDNSPSSELRQANAAICAANGVECIDMGGNAGLSRAYNAGFRLLSRRQPPPEWVILLDQDTSGLEGYIASLSALDPNRAEIFVPSVEAAGRLLSPRYFAKIPIRQSEIPEYSGARRCAINSGMAVHFPLWQEVGGYDEAIFLDYVDYDFLLCAYQKRPGLSLALLDARLQQEFSGDTISTGDLTRYRIYRKDLSVFAAKHGVPKLRLLSLLARRALHLAIAHRSLRFLLEVT